MKILTNLPFAPAAMSCECHHPNVSTPPKNAPYGLLDREDDWGAVTEPDETTPESQAKAIAQRKEDYRLWKDWGVQSVGNYGLPIMLNDRSMEKRASMLAAVLPGTCDWFCPTVYDIDPEDPGIVLKRAEWARTCIDRAGPAVRQLPMYGCLCPIWSPKGVQCIIGVERLALQVMASKHCLKAQGLYIWDPISWRIWQAKLHVPGNHPSAPHIKEGRAILESTYGFGMAASRNWESNVVDQLARAYTQRILNQVQMLWGTV